MDLKVEAKIPCIEFTENVQNLVQGSDEWNILSKTVREAAEEYGVFQVIYDKIPAYKLQKMFEAAKELFDLPLETKRKCTASVPQHGYIGNSELLPLFESLGIENARSLEEAQAFTQLMWPDGNPDFCETFTSMSHEMHELGLIVLKMLMESYGVGKYYDSYLEKNDALFRAMKYDAPHTEDPVLGIPAHADRDSLTVLYQNSVQGLVVQLKGGNWIPVKVHSGAFIVFIGEALKAWSKGRVAAAEHKVMMTGEETRYSFGSFVIPKQGVEIESPSELEPLCEKDPQVYKSLSQTEYIDFFYQGDQKEDDASKKA